MKKRRLPTTLLDPTIRAAAVGMLKEGIKSPTIARLLDKTQTEIRGNLGWWVHERMQAVQGRTFAAYRIPAEELRVGYQAVMRWHEEFLMGCQVSPDEKLVALATEEYCRQTPNVRERMRWKLKGRAEELELLREAGYSI